MRIVAVAGGRRTRTCCNRARGRCLGRSHTKFCMWAPITALTLRTSPMNRRTSRVSRGSSSGGEYHPTMVLSLARRLFQALCRGWSMRVFGRLRPEGTCRFFWLDFSPSPVTHTLPNTLALVEVYDFACGGSAYVSEVIFVPLGEGSALFL